MHPFQEVTMSSNISAIVNSVKQSLHDKMFFEFSQYGRYVEIKEKIMDRNETFTHLVKLSQYTIDILKTTDIRSLPSKEKKEEIRDLVDVVYRCSKIFEQKFGKIDGSQAHYLYLLAFRAKLGGRVSEDALRDPQHKDFETFMHVNFLYQKMQALGYQMGTLPSLMIEGFHEPVLWSSLRKDLIDPSNPDSGFSFSYNGKEVFRTNANFELDEDYSYIDGKIAKYNPLMSKEIRYYDKEAANPGVFKVELWTTVIDHNGERPTVTLGDHTYLVLVDDQGRRLGVGQYGIAGERNCAQDLSPMGRRLGGIETPDRYLLLPKDQFNSKKTEFVVSKADFEILLQEVKDLKAGSHHVISLLQNNCTSFAQKILARIGINIETKFHVLELLFRRHAPLLVCSFFDKIFAKVPQGIKNALYYLPFIYLPTLFAACVIRLKSLRNYRADNTHNSVFEFFFKPWKCPSDIYLLDIIFRPWRLTADHPFAVRIWQNKNPSNIYHN